MIEFLKLAFLGVLIPAMATFVSKVIINGLLSKKEKILTISDRNGKTHEITIPIKSNRIEINKIVLKEIELEKYIYITLNELKLKNSNITVSNDNFFDFIVTNGNKYIAIEAKNNMNYVKNGEISRYASEIDKRTLNKVIFVTNSKLKTPASKEAKLHKNANKIQFIISSTPQKLAKNLESALTNELL